MTDVSSDQIPILVVSKRMQEDWRANEYKSLRFYIVLYRSVYENDPGTFELLYAEHGRPTMEKIQEHRDTRVAEINRRYNVRLGEVLDFMRRMLRQIKIDAAEGRAPLEAEGYYHSAFSDMRKKYHVAYSTMMSGKITTDDGLLRVLHAVHDPNAHSEEHGRYLSMIGSMASDIRGHVHPVEVLGSASDESDGEAELDADFLAYLDEQYAEISERFPKHYRMVISQRGKIELSPMIVEFSLDLKQKFGLYTPEEAHEVLLYFVTKQFPIDFGAKK